VSFITRRKALKYEPEQVEKRNPTDAFILHFLIVQRKVLVLSQVNIRYPFRTEIGFKIKSKIKIIPKDYQSNIINLNDTNIIKHAG